MKRLSQFWMVNIWLTALVAALLMGCTTDTDEPSFVNPFDPDLGAGIPIPDSITVLVGDNTVTISWGLPEGETAEEFAIFRKRTDLFLEEEEVLLARVTDTEYTDRSVRNGRSYTYRIAASIDGQFGTRTDEIEARPGLFSIILANDALLTNSREIIVSFQLGNAEAVRLSEDSGVYSAPWHSAGGSLSWTLSAGDGSKTVYAQFRLADGSESVPVSDTIELDTKAAIRFFSFEGSEIRSPGDTIHFSLISDEPHGAATVSIAGVFSSVPLFDDGSNGDTTADDGIYERDLTIPPATAVQETDVVGSFVDEAGNSAINYTAADLLTVRESPDPVDLLDVQITEPPDAPQVTIRWSLSQEENFAAYRIFRSELPTVDLTDRLIGTVTNKNTIEQQDSDIVEGKSYYYRVYLQDTFGLEAGSNTVSAVILNERPPSAVNLQTPSSTGTTRIALDWSASADLDFQSYKIYRNETGAVTDDDELLAEITDVGRTFWDDAGLQEDTTYYYRLYVSDLGGLNTRSNEVEAHTLNAAPSAVTLHQPSATSETQIALSWSQSEDLDFFSYRLYRNETGAVSEESDLIVEISDPDQTYWDDTDLRENTVYYYRVYTGDLGGLTARSDEVEAQTKNEPPLPVVLNEAADVDTMAVTLSWEASTAHDFEYYRLYRDEISTVTTSSHLVVEMDDESFVSFRDTDLDPGTRYYYRVFVIDDATESEATGSNTVTIVTLDE
jgi:hypothetical protein